MRIRPRTLLAGAAAGAVLGAAAAALAIDTGPADADVALPVFDDPPAASPLAALPPIDTDDLGDNLSDAVAPAPEPIDAPVRQQLANPPAPAAAPRPVVTAPRPPDTTQRSRAGQARGEHRRAAHNTPNDADRHHGNDQ